MASTEASQLQPQQQHPLRVRTLEILWHCNERNEEAERLGMQSTLVEGITCVDYNLANDRLVTAGGDGCLRMWQLDLAALDAWLVNGASDMTASCGHVCTMRTSWMPLVARWSPQGKVVASGHCEGKVCLWWRDHSVVAGGGSPTSPARGTESDRLEEWKDYRHLTGHISDVYDLAFSPDSRYLLSGAADGSIVIHDLDGSTMPVLQLTELHSKFCRGVAWDPWNRYVVTCGNGPALQCFTHVPRREGGKRMHLAAQRKCQGDFLGESCALSSRRPSWSPDGSLLAVPFGKVPRSHASTSNLLDAIDAKAKREKENTTLSADPSRAVSAGRASGDPPHLSATADGVAEKAVEPINEEAEDREEEEDMVHCVNIYARGALDKLAARLVIRGYNEVRGVRWAPCVLEPLPHVEPLPMVLSPDTVVGTPSEVRGGLNEVGGDVSGEGSAGAHPRQLSTSTAATVPREEVFASAPFPPSPPPPPSETTPMTSSSLAQGQQQQAALASSSPAPAVPPLSSSFSSSPPPTVQALSEAKETERGEAWGPVDYRMVLAAWSSDAVIVYTTDSATRHSDFTDLHMRSITDVAWNRDATFLFTSSLDGYISVVSFGTSLTVAHRLPTFSSRPVTQATCRLLTDINETSQRQEASRSSRAEQEAAAASSATAAAAPVVVVVRKKRKTETPAVATDMELNQLEALMSGT